MSKNKEINIGGNFDQVITTPMPDCENMCYFTTKHYYVTRVIYNGPATIVFWNDGTKTTSKCGENDAWNPETGLALCYLKKVVGGKEVKRYLRDWIPTAEEIDAPEIVKTIHDVRRALKNGTVKND